MKLEARPAGGTVIHKLIHIIHNFFRENYLFTKLISKKLIEAR